MSSLSFGMKSDVGRIYEVNHDHCAAYGKNEIGAGLDGLFIVADGMGLGEGSRLASNITVEVVTQSLREILEQYDLEAELKVLEVGIRQAATLANKAVYRHSRANPDVGNMGSTCVLAGVAQGKAVLGYAGDSRIYLLRSGKMRQLTSDHVRYQMVNEGEAQGMAAVVSRGMGLSSTLEVDLDTLDLEEGDTLLLCSDGVTDMVAEDDIARILATTLEAQATADALVALANLNGGRDNITALVVRYGDFKPLPPNTFAAPQNAPPPPRNGSTQAPPKSGGCAGKAAMLAVAMVFVTHTLWTLLRP